MRTAICDFEFLACSLQKKRCNDCKVLTAHGQSD
jgi:hypothetical protein